ncbi:MAG: T9SS type A sorting domain-containing protein [Bernardetiaceae bacterium]|nr:T9SS type A sorting domain-containing protein [Bernardetiaceae bacterium]
MPGGMTYLEYLPPNYNPSQRYPVIFYLHGMGEKGDNPQDIWRITNGGLPKMLQSGTVNMTFTANGTTSSFIVISPQLTNAYGDWDIPFPNFYNYILNNYPIDRSRVYLTGFSMGGGSTWRLARNHPTWFAGIAPIAGAAWPASSSDPCQIASGKIAVWAFHGDSDNMVQLSHSQAWVNGMNQCQPAPNPAPRLTVYPGQGHSWTVVDNAYRTDNSLHTPNLFQWFLQHRIGGTIDIKDTPPPDQTLVVNAGADQTVRLPQSSTVLDGSGTVPSAGRSITGWWWRQNSGPNQATLTNPATARCTASNLVAGTYRFELIATDGRFQFSDFIQITVLPSNNQPPAVTAGPNQSFRLPQNSVTLDASATRDPDGTIASWAWIQVSGPNSASIANGTTARPTMGNLVAGVYVFQVTATDSGGASGNSQVTVDVQPAVVANRPPVARAGSDVTITLPQNSTMLDGTGSFDPDNVVTSWWWRQTTGPNQSTITNPATARPTANGLVAGRYTFELIVSDGSLNASDFVDVIVQPGSTPPAGQANITAGPDQTITLPQNTTVLDATASRDAAGQPMKSWWWRQTAGPAQSILATPAAGRTNVSGLVAGVYTFEIIASDGSVNRSAFVRVTVQAGSGGGGGGQAIVTAGPDQTITLPQSTTVLDATASRDAAGQPMKSWWWRQNAGPSQATFATPAAGRTNVSGLVAGVYTFEIIASDGSVNRSAFVKVTVQAGSGGGGGGQAIVTAGPDQTITLPQSTTVLDASASRDAAGQPMKSWWWRRTAGPSQVTLATPAAARTNVSGLVAGVYTFEIIAWDGTVNRSAFVKVTVQSSGGDDIPPPPPASVTAGPDQTITLPQSTTALDASASRDAAGQPMKTWWWRQQSGPNQATFATPAAARTNVSGLVAGVYTFEIIAGDGTVNRSAFVKVTVQSGTGGGGNSTSPPVANAGPDRSERLPLSTIVLDGSNSRAATGNTLTGWSWRLIEGERAIIMQQANTSRLTLSGLFAGIFKFELTVTDNLGGTHSDQVTVTIQPGLVPGDGINGIDVGACGCDVVITPQSGWFGGTYGGDVAVDGRTVGARPGHTVCLVAGYYPSLLLTNFNGTASQPITIRNCGGQVIIGRQGQAYGLVFHTGTYIKLTGSGHQGERYGIWIKDAGRTGPNAIPANGLSLSNGSTNFEAEFIRISNVSYSGVNAKSDPECNKPQYWAQNFVMRDIKLHDLWVQQTGGEGIYCGFTPSAPNCSGQLAEPHVIDGLQVYNNIVENTGYDAIQISRVVSGLAVYNNRIINHGTRNDQTNQAAILLGGNTTGDIYGNYIANPDIESHAAIHCFGIGNTKIYNNILNKTNGIYINDRQTANGRSFSIYNNTIVNNSWAAIYFDAPTTSRNNFIGNNLIHSLNGNHMIVNQLVPMTFGNNVMSDDISRLGFVNSASDFRLQAGSPAIDAGRTVPNVTLTTDHDGNARPRGRGIDVGALESDLSAPAGNLPPVANPGNLPDLRLPLGYVWIEGAHSYDPDGSIASYRWEQVIPPPSQTWNVPRIEYNNRSTLSLRDLVPGVFTYRLTVTDNQGATSSALAKVTLRRSDGTLPVMATRIEEEEGAKTSGLPEGAEPRIYPNPSSVEVNVEVPQANGGYQYVLYSTAGEAVLKGTGEQAWKLNVSGLARGAYVLHLITEKGRTTHKIVVGGTKAGD